jgi:hypothetical protein
MAEMKFSERWFEKRRFRRLALVLGAHVCASYAAAPVMTAVCGIMEGWLWYVFAPISIAFVVAFNLFRFFFLVLTFGFTLGWTWSDAAIPLGIYGGLLGFWLSIGWCILRWLAAKSSKRPTERR